MRKIPYTKSGMSILIFEIRRLISYMSPANRGNLAYFIMHLKRITDRQHITEMSPNALAVIFANIIFKTSCTCSSSIPVSPLVNGKSLSSSVNSVLSFVDTDGDEPQSPALTNLCHTHFPTFKNRMINTIKRHSYEDIIHRAAQQMADATVPSPRFVVSKEDPQSGQQNLMTNINKNGQVVIVLDVTFKIRIIELMICHANEIFA